jgi:hypothetical protein
MISPIALQTCRDIASGRRLGRGEGGTVKGTGRRRTSYPRPPIVELIGMCGSIQALGRLRGALATGAFHGTITPSEKTERAWERAFWKRAAELILSSDRPTFIYNYMIRWPRPQWARELIEMALELQCKSLPSDAERLLQQGIIIQGVTSHG